MKFIKPLFIIIGLIAIACHNEQNRKRTINRSNEDTVIKEIPDWYAPGSLGQRIDKKRRQQLNLPDLQNGFDSLQIRIWIDCGYRTSSLILLEYKRSQWHAMFYSFKTHY